MVSDTFVKVREIVEKQLNYTQGQRNEYIYNFACVACKYGINQEITEYEILRFKDANQTQREVQISVKSAYKNSKFGEYDKQIDFKAFKKVEEKEYKRPKWNNKTKLCDNIVKWFEGRKISQTTLKNAKVTTGKDWMPQYKAEVDTIRFNYFRNNELINIKYRTSKKDFKLHSGAELILYNLDSIKDSNVCYIVEGEMDALSLMECGIQNVVSVPNGAKKGNDKLEYIDNCVNELIDIEQFIIVTDNDTAGEGLKKNLANRLGVEKCSYINLNECKDPNEFLCKYTAIELLEICQNFIPFPVTGIFTITDIEIDLDDYFYNGLNKGALIGVEKIDNILSFERGMLYVWTGIPSHGKSTFLDFVNVKLNIKSGIKTGYCSLEAPPKLHVPKLIECLVNERYGMKYMNEETYHQAKTYINDNFFFMFPDTEESDFSVDGILKKFRIMRFRYGIVNFIIDPYNKIEHKKSSSQSETEYISQFLDKVKMFAIKENVIMHIVAHPRKMQKNGVLHETPTLYDINGSANWYNKPDFGITIYRDMNTNIVSMIVQKAKWKHLAENGCVEMIFNTISNRYTPVFDDGVPDGNHDKTNWLIPSSEGYDTTDIMNNSDFEVQTEEIPF